MKLKFRASGKDILIFLVFSVVLLYLVAVAVLNISSFATDGSFHGFNPLDAFTPEYIAPTLIGFVFFIIFILTSVSSYFFDREAGFGITTKSKEEKGYSRWATDKEMKKSLKTC